KELAQNNKNLLLLDFKEQEKLKANTDSDEWIVVGKIINQLPENSVLHLGNSSPIRYLLNWNFILKDKNIEVQANRGTSGIDGCVSTAVGMAQADERKHTLIIGDLAMMYDRNGLWHKHIPSNLTIVVINNQGGGIFRKIEGPKKQPELEEYFVNAQPCDFESLAKMHGLVYEQFRQIPTYLHEKMVANVPYLFEWLVE
ncbi:MAG: hypothetical protein KDC92_04435, partial [Bacteroidetes bacterium]|nr:hypothetical protein [Bacteroidota bacterium]